MKVLIWIVSIVICSTITVSLKSFGVVLGGVPTVILYGGATWIASTLCKKWDESTGNDSKSRFDEIYGTSPQQDVEDGYQESEKICFCRKCGEKLIDGSKFCRKCGTEVIVEDGEVITSPAVWIPCKKCGADISKDTDCCHFCGKKIFSNDE